MHPPRLNSMHLHPAPPNYIHLHPAHFNLNPAHFSLHPALCNTLSVIRPKILHIIGQLPKFRPKNSKLSILIENWHAWYIVGADSESRLRFLKFWSQNLSWANLGRKRKSFFFCLKIGTNSISRMLIPLSTWISNPKPIFGQIWAKKVKVIHFCWKLAHIVSWGCWFLFWH